MKGSRAALVLVSALALLSTQVLRADVRSEQKTKFQLAGALGKVVNFFGGSAARDGVTSTVAVKGNRMMTTSGTTTGQIIDLGEEKIYDLDLRRKQYTVLTFAQYRQRIEDAAKKAQEHGMKILEVEVIVQRGLEIVRCHQFHQVVHFRRTLLACDTLIHRRLRWRKG